MFTLLLQKDGLYDKLKAGPITKELIFELKLVLELGGFSFNQTEFWNYAKAEFPGNLLMLAMTVVEPSRIIAGLREFEAEPWYQKAARVLCTKFTSKQDEDMHSMFDVVEKYWNKNIFDALGMISLTGQEYSVKPEFREVLGEVFTGPNADRPREGFMVKNESYQNFYVVNILWLAEQYSSYEIVKDKATCVSGGRPCGEVIRLKGKVSKETFVAMLFFLPLLKKETTKAGFDKKYPGYCYNTDLGAFKALPTVEDYLKANGQSADTYKRMTASEFLALKGDSYTYSVIARYADRIFSK